MGKVVNIKPKPSSPPKEYEMTWRNKGLTDGAKSIDDMERTFRSCADLLAAMSKAGVRLRVDSGIEDDYATLVTTDPEVAKKFGLEVCE